VTCIRLATDDVASGRCYFPPPSLFMFEVGIVYALTHKRQHKLEASHTHTHRHTRTHCIVESLIPQAGIVGDMRISYAKFLQLLEADRVKRVVVYGDMKTAVVEVSVVV